MVASLLLAAINLTPANVEVVVPKTANRDARVVQYAAEEMTNFLSRIFGAPESVPAGSTAPTA